MRKESANGDRLALGLGWFSIGLGLVGVMAPRSIARAIGARTSPGLLRLLGLREIFTGIGILSRPQPAPWLKTRVAGDAMDLALLGSAFFAKGSQPSRLATATAAVAGVTALDVFASRKFSRRPGANLSRVHVKSSVVINRPAEELYRFWRDFENLPRFMSHLESVHVLDDKRSHWVAKGPAGLKAEWDAEIVQEHPNRLMAWRSLPGADVDHAGSVRFEPARGGRGTLVRVQVEYQPPAGVLGATVARVFGEAPEKQIAVEMLRFKQLMETGEIARTEDQPAGRSRSTSVKYDELVRH